MKKIVLTILVSLMFPISILAQTYNVMGNEIVISLDEQKWAVVTRNNLYENSVIEEFELDAEKINDMFVEYYIYLYAIYKEDSNLVFYLRSDYLPNRDIKLEEYAQQLVEETSADEYQTYEKNNKFIKIEYTDNGLNMITYITFNDSKFYSFSAQKKLAFTQIEKNEIEKIIDNIILTKNIENSENKEIWIEIISKIIGSTFGCLLFCYLYKKLNIDKIKNS